MNKLLRLWYFVSVLNFKFLDQLERRYCKDTPFFRPFYIGARKGPFLWGLNSWPTCLSAQMSVRSKAIFFETQWAVKTLVFRRKFCSLQTWGVGKKCAKKKGPKRFLIPPTFCKTWSAKIQSILQQGSVLFWHPPPHPFWAAICANWDFLAWNWNYHAVDINMGQGRSVRTSRVFCLDQWWSPAAWMNFL